MFRRLACLLLVLLSWVPVVASADGLVVRAEFSPTQAWVGQQVVLQVDVLAADAWAQLDGIPHIELPGAYVLPPQGQGVRLQETLDGRSHSGQRYEFFIYPQRAGTLSLPATGIEVRISRFGDAASAETVSAALPGLAFESRTPPGTEGIAGLLSTPDLRVEQRWEPAGGLAQVGDALRRSIRFEAADISGMAFRPLEHAPLDGFGVYPAEPQVDDRYNRGKLQGSRTETVTYIAERAGQFEFPAIRFTWWDTAGEQLQQVELPGRSVSISGVTNAAAPSAVDPFSRPWWWLAAAAAVMGLIVLGRPVLRLWRAAAKKRAQSEYHRFRLLQAAIRRGRPAQVLRELMRWLDRINASARPARIDVFLDRYGDAQTRAALDTLQRQVDDGGRITDRAALASHLKRARERWLRQSGEHQDNHFALPPLNGAPTGET
jgi:hypothetical protein